MKHYHHLTEVERYQIEAHLRMGVNLAAIAAHLDRPRSCISREVSRNGGSTEYRAEHAQVCYREQLRAKGKLRQRWHAAFHEVMVPLLREGWSPEQISGVFRGSACAVSHEWVYQRILQDKQSGGLVYRHLRCQKQRKKRYGSPERRGQIINRRGISERPAEVESRQQLGHWEGDTMIGAGHRGALVTLVERTSGLVKIQRVTNKEAKGVTRAIHRMLSPHRSKVHSITFDNGKEFAGHETIARLLKADCYFADPYSSWQRGSNENTNGLIRQYFPKKTDFTTLSDKEIAEVERKLNNRPRKRLGFRSPNQVFNEGNFLNQKTS